MLNTKVQVGRNFSENRKKIKKDSNILNLGQFLLTLQQISGTQNEATGNRLGVLCVPFMHVQQKQKDLLCLRRAYM